MLLYNVQYNFKSYISLTTPLIFGQIHFFLSMNMLRVLGTVYTGALKLLGCLFGRVKILCSQ